MRNNRSLLGPKSVVFFSGTEAAARFYGGVVIARSTLGECMFVCKLNVFWDEFLRISIALADCEKEGYH